MNEVRAYVTLSGLILILVAVYLVASDLSHEDEVAVQERYCEMTKAGYWPEYKVVHDQVCRE